MCPRRVCNGSESPMQALHADIWGNDRPRILAASGCRLYSVELLVQGRIPWMMLDARQICASKLFLAIVGSSRSITSTCMRSRPRALSSHSVEAARITLQHVPRHEPCQVVSLPDFVGNLRISVLLFVSRPHVLLFKGMRLFPTD